MKLQQDRPWNNPGPARKWPLCLGQAASETSTANVNNTNALPVLRAIVLDFSSIDMLDVTAVQALEDLRADFARYAEPIPVAWHFACVQNKWARRALSAAGFGRGPASDGWAPLLGVCSGESGAGSAGEDEGAGLPKTRGPSVDVVEEQGPRQRLLPVLGTNLPLFHLDVLDAVASAVASVEAVSSGV